MNFNLKLKPLELLPQRSELSNRFCVLFFKPFDLGLESSVISPFHPITDFCLYGDKDGSNEINPDFISLRRDHG